MHLIITFSDSFSSCVNVNSLITEFFCTNVNLKKILEHRKLKIAYYTPIIQLCSNVLLLSVSKHGLRILQGIISNECAHEMDANVHQKTHLSVAIYEPD